MDYVRKLGSMNIFFLVNIVVDLETLRGSGTLGTTSLVDSELRLAVGLGANLELLLGGGDVGIVALPCGENRLLQSASVREGELPWLLVLITKLVDAI